MPWRRIATIAANRPPHGPSEKKSGGQPGHPGHPGHTLERVAVPDIVVAHAPTHCRRCQWPLADCAHTVIERRQVHDLPPLRLEVTEHQTLAARCSASQTVTRGSFLPEVTAPTLYGPGVRALAVYLNQYQLVPTARTQEALPDVVDCGVSEGTLVAWVAKAAITLAPSVARIADLVAANLHLHADEIGMRIDGKLHWLHVASTRWLTHLTWHAKRGRAATEAIGIWPRFRGRATHDHLASYGAYTACRHGLCGAHLVRELTFLEAVRNSTDLRKEAVWSKAGDSLSGLGKDCQVDDAEVRRKARRHSVGIVPGASRIEAVAPAHDDGDEVGPGHGIERQVRPRPGA